MAVTDVAWPDLSLVPMGPSMTLWAEVYCDVTDADPGQPTPLEAAASPSLRQQSADAVPGSDSTQARSKPATKPGRSHDDDDDDDDENSDVNDSDIDDCDESSGGDDDDDSALQRGKRASAAVRAKRGGGRSGSPPTRGRGRRGGRGAASCVDSVHHGGSSVGVENSDSHGRASNSTEKKRGRPGAATAGRPSKAVKASKRALLQAALATVSGDDGSAGKATVHDGDADDGGDGKAGNVAAAAAADDNVVLFPRASAPSAAVQVR